MKAWVTFGRFRIVPVLLISHRSYILVAFSYLQLPVNDFFSFTVFIVHTFAPI